MTGLRVLIENETCVKEIPVESHTIGKYANKVKAIFTLFAAVATKARWKGLRQYFRNE
jgi:hypothetical protein